MAPAGGGLISARELVRVKKQSATAQSTRSELRKEKAMQEQEGGYTRNVSTSAFLAAIKYFFFHFHSDSASIFFTIEVPEQCVPFS